MKRKEFLQNSLLISGALITGSGSLGWANDRGKKNQKQSHNAYGLLPLHIKENKIYNSANKEVNLRGTNIGGWMLMEDFINGYPGMEHSLRARMAKAMGPEKASFFFNTYLDYFFAEADAKFLSEIGCTAVRLPINYRHFEDDLKPYEYKEEGFKRLKNAVDICAKYGIYSIIDVHAAQGWQSDDWHCDNVTRRALLWTDKLYQDRFVEFWKEIARRFKGNNAVAGYDLLNEPMCNAPLGRYGTRSLYEKNFEPINGLYRRTVNEIRKIDGDHIIFLEGDYFSSFFDGFEPPFAKNLAYSSHNYQDSARINGAYPGYVGDKYWDYEAQEKEFLKYEGTQFTKKHNVPLWVSEFGASVLNDDGSLPGRVQALTDQIMIMNKYNAHWSIWTYKGFLHRGIVNVHKDSEYYQTTLPVTQRKEDFEKNNPVPELAKKMETMADFSGIKASNFSRYLNKHVQANFYDEMLQEVYVDIFSKMTETQIDQVLKTVSFAECEVNKPLSEVISKCARYA